MLATAPLPNDNGPLGRRTLSGHSCSSEPNIETLCAQTPAAWGATLRIGNRRPLWRCQTPVFQGLDGTSSVLTCHPVQAVYAEITRPQLLSVLYTSGPPGPDAERLDSPRCPEGPDSTRYGSSSRAGNRKRHQPSTWHLRAFVSARITSPPSAVYRHASRPRWGVASDSSQRMAVENRLTLWIMTTI